MNKTIRKNVDFKTETQLRQELSAAWALVDAYKEDSQRLQFLIDSRATLQYSQRDGEGAQHCEVHAEQWCRRETLREALDVLRSNVDFSGSTPLYGGESAGKQGSASPHHED